MRSLIDLVGRRRPAEPAESEPSRRPAGETSDAGPPEPEQAATSPANPERTAADLTKPTKETKASAVQGRETGGAASDPVGDPADGAAGGAGEGADRGAEGGSTHSAADGAGDDQAGGAGDGPDGDPKAGDEPADHGRSRPGRGRRSPVVLGIVTVLLGGTAAWCADEADRVRTASGGGNVALTDVAATSDVKGVVTDAVDTIFSFDYADMARTRQAADHVLTGDAVRQYDAMVAEVRAQAPRQKLVLTTTVTDSAVEMLQDGRARLLLFADQRSTRTVAKDTTYAAAMLAVDAVRRGGDWKISAIDTLTGRR